MPSVFCPTPLCVLRERRLSVAGCRLRAVGCGLSVAGCAPPQDMIEDALDPACTDLEAIAAVLSQAAAAGYSHPASAPY